MEPLEHDIEGMILSIVEDVSDDDNGSNEFENLKKTLMDVIEYNRE